MPNQPTQSQDYRDGIDQAFKVALIHVSPFPGLKEALEKERDIYLSVPITPLTKKEIDLKEIEEATYKSELLNTSLELNIINFEKLKAGVAFIESKGYRLE